MSGSDDHLTLAQVELGEPDALFHVSPAWFRAKLAVGIGLLLVGIAINYWWWVHGPQNLQHSIVHLLFWPPAMGVALLVHMYRQRGLFVLVYPTGLLRLRRGEVDSYPWSEIGHVRLKVQRAEVAEITRDAGGSPTACWLPAEAPTIQIWNAGLTLTRADGVEAHFGPALANYERFAEEVQRRTFPFAWADAWGRFLAGQAVEFGDIEATQSGIRYNGKLLPWREVKELTIAQGKLSVKQVGKWLPWALLKDMNDVPNPHVLFALIVEARRLSAASSLTSPPRQDAEGSPDDDP